MTPGGLKHGMLQDILCRFNIWHKYTDWQGDSRSYQNGAYIGFTQSRYCYNCNWRKICEIPPKTIRIREG